MSNKSSSDSAATWTKRLVEKTLPTLSRSSTAILNALQKDNLSYQKLSKMINRDPVLAFAVTVDANKNMKDGSEGCKTLEHAISLIGVERLKQITEKMRVEKSDIKEVGHFYYTRSISSSLLAAEIAQTMAERKKPLLSQDVYWSTLFSRAPLWYLWRYATPEMRLIRYAIRSNFKLPEIAEREVLGATIEEISQGIISKLKPGHLVTSLWRNEKQLTAREWVFLSRNFDEKGSPKQIYDAHLNLKINDPTFFITLADRIAGHAAHDWYSRTILRYQKILAVWLGISLSDAISLTHLCAVKASRQHPFPGIMLPAAKLLLPPRTRIKAHASAAQQPSELKKIYEEKTQSRPISTQTLTDVPDRSSTSRGNPQIFNELIHIMRHQPENFTDIHELMNAATQGLAFGLGLHRSIVGLVNAQNTRLKAYYSVGVRDNPELGKFEIDLKKPSIFQRLIEKPASIWVKPTSSKNIWNMIPMEFKKICGSTEFFLMSVFVRKKPVAIFYADIGEASGTINEEDYTQFKHLCGATASCLHQIALKKPRKLEH